MIKKNLIIPLSLIIVTAPLTTVKIFNIQISEIMSGITIAMAWAGRSTIEKKYSAEHVWIYLYKSRFITFLIALLVTGFLDTWRLSVPLPVTTEWLKQPYFLTISRVIELFIATQIVPIFWTEMNKNGGLSGLMASLYSQAGLIACIYSIVNFVLCNYGLEIPLWGKPSYIGVIRAQGTFVEPGPFGLYVASILMMELIRVRNGEKVNAVKWNILVLALLLTVSKAAFLSLTIMSIICVFYLKRSRTKIVVIIAFCFIFPLILFAIAEWYIRTIASIDYGSHPLLDGRMMAYYAIPRMIELSPWLGIGFGNYPLMRNSQLILQGMPMAQFWDLHGAGLVGVAAEMGILLFIWFMALIIWTLSKPLKNLSDNWIKAALWFPVISFVSGLQIHFLYPWIYLAISHGLVNSKQSDSLNLNK